MNNRLVALIIVVLVGSVGAGGLALARGPQAPVSIADIAKVNPDVPLNTREIQVIALAPAYAPTKFLVVFHTADEKAVLKFYTTNPFPDRSASPPNGPACPPSFVQGCVPKTQKR